MAKNIVFKLPFAIFGHNKKYLDCITNYVIESSKSAFKFPINKVKSIWKQSFTGDVVMIPISLNTQFK